MVHVTSCQFWEIYKFIYISSEKTVLTFRWGLRNGQPQLLFLRLHVKATDKMQKVNQFWGAWPYHGLLPLTRWSMARATSSERGHVRASGQAHSQSTWMRANQAPIAWVLFVCVCVCVCVCVFVCLSVITTVQDSKLYRCVVEIKKMKAMFKDGRVVTKEYWAGGTQKYAID